jgi:hypothetical protein
VPRENLGVKKIDEIYAERLHECIDAVHQEFRSAIVPIYGSGKSGRPFHIASSILLNIAGARAILTASHVLDWSRENNLYIGTSILIPISLKFLATKPIGGKRSEDRADFAIALLSEEMISYLAGAKFVDESEIARPRTMQARPALTCLGYPNSKNRRESEPSSAIDCQLASLTSAQKEPSKLFEKLSITSETHVFLDRKKFSKDLAGNRIPSFAVRGMSGGAVFDLGNFMALDRLTGPCRPFLIGLFIEFYKDHECIVATQLSYILEEIKRRKLLG